MVELGTPIATKTDIQQITISCTILAGESEIVEQGFVYNSTGTPTISDTKVIVTGTLETSINDIPDGINYFKAYAYNGTTTVYSSEINVTIYAIVLDTLSATKTETRQITLNCDILNNVAPWSETFPAGDTNQFWKCASMSATGQYILVGGSRLYLSSDYGKNWTEVQPAGDADKNWRTCNMIGLGAYMIAGVYGGRLYVSYNFGVDWSEYTAFGSVDRNWSCCDITRYQMVLAGVYGGRLYSNSAHISPAIETRPYGDVDAYWTVCQMSDRGEYSVCGAENEVLKYSQTYHINWYTSTYSGTQNGVWRSLSMSNSGQYIIVCTMQGVTYTSSNYGVDLTVVSSVPFSSAVWGLSVSGNGKNMMYAIYEGRVYISTDYGSNWNETQPVGDTDKFWVMCAINDEATLMLAGINGGRVYWSLNRVAEKGFVYNSTGNPTITDTKLTTPADFDTIMNNVIYGDYYFKAYVLDVDGYDVYSNEELIQITYTPLISTPNISNLSYFSFDADSSITEYSGTILEKGFVYNTTGSPSKLDNVVVTETTFDFTYTMTEHTPVLYIKSFAENNIGITYSDDVEVTFLTDNLIQIKTNDNSPAIKISFN